MAVCNGNESTGCLLNVKKMIYRTYHSKESYCINHVSIVNMPFLIFKTLHIN